MATQEERKAKTRLKIINTAKTLFHQKGFNRTSVEQIYTKANFSKGTFYKHFKTKMDVLIAVEKEQGRVFNRSTLEQVEAGENALKVLHNYMESLGKWFEEREKTAETMVMTQLLKPSHLSENSDPETSTRGFILKLITYAQQQSVIRNDVEPKLLAQVLGGVIVAAIINWCHQPEHGVLIKNLQDSLAVFLEGTHIKANQL